MEYVREKREKNSICNICRKTKPLSWDHVPPKGGVDIKPVHMHTIFSKLTGEEPNTKARVSQNGMKYRTICRDCNSLLGTEYDGVINELALTVGDSLKNNSTFEDIFYIEVKVVKLIKAVLGHLLAAKVEIENTSFDKSARDYVLGKKEMLDDEVNIFYWVFPYDLSIIIRDFLMFTPRGTFKKPEIFQTLKYFPIAYLCTTANEYEGLPSLTEYKHLNEEETISLPLSLDKVFPYFWPERPEGNNIFAGGQSANNSVFVTPKKK